MRELWRPLGWAIVALGVFGLGIIPLTFAVEGTALETCVKGSRLDGVSTGDGTMRWSSSRSLIPLGTTCYYSFSDGRTVVSEPDELPTGLLVVSVAAIALGRELSRVRPDRSA